MRAGTKALRFIGPAALQIPRRRVDRASVLVVHDAARRVVDLDDAAGTKPDPAVRTFIGLIPTVVSVATVLMTTTAVCIQHG